MKISETEEHIGERLDKVVAKMHPEYSRASIEKLVVRGDITVNGQQKPSRYKLRHGDVVEVDLSYLQRPASSVKLPIIYEDEDVIVINKPAGILTHAKGEFNKEATVATFIKPKLNGEVGWKESNRAGIVHRLDRATSGVIICAKNKPTQDYLQGQFSKRKVKKTYLAVIKGSAPEPEGLIDVPIERNPKKPATFRAGINGKSAQTHFKVLTVSNKYSLVELKPITGRTHQLRVHLSHLKIPIVGDAIYGGDAASRLMLHAYRLELTLPSRKRIVFTADLPNNFMVLNNE